MAGRTIVAGFLGAALLAAGCRDAVSPERGLPGTIQLDVAAPSGITLDTLANTLNQRGLNVIIKGFNPRNPLNGDAVIATFFWVGDHNIIDSVTDHLTNPQFPPVGNPYTLVEYVTAGGLSMATYIATNLRNVPPPDAQQPGEVYAVRANLSTTITDGGVDLSAWRGVAADFAQAVGAHRHGSGTASSETLVGPGAIPVNAGALAYAVTMSDAGAGRFPPAGFGEMVTMGDGTLFTQSDSAVQAGAGTVDPQWRVFFGNDPKCTPATPCTWLASALALNPGGGAPPPNQPPIAAFTPTCSGLDCTFTSTSSDPDGSITAYSWSFGDGGTSAAQSPSHSYTAEGTYTVRLTVTDNQDATSFTETSVTVRRINLPPVASFIKTCSLLTCTFTSTSSDPDGSITAYAWSFGDGGTSTVPNPSHSYTSGGTYTVWLTVTDDQGATSTTSQSVTVIPPNSPPVVNAGPDATAFTGLLYSFSWSFSDANNNGPWSYRIDWGDGSTTTGSKTSQGTFSSGHTYVILLPRSFTIRVTVTDAAGASGSDTKVVQVLLL